MEYKGLMDRLLQILFSALSYTPQDGRLADFSILHDLELGGRLRSMENNMSNCWSSCLSLGSLEWSVHFKKLEI